MLLDELFDSVVGMEWKAKIKTMYLIRCCCVNICLLLDELFDKPFDKLFVLCCNK